MKKILIIAAHPDDEVLGCGGTIAKLRKSGCKVNLLFLSDGENSRLEKKDENKNLYRQKCAINALKILGVNKRNCKFESLPDNSFDTISFLKIVKVIENHITKINPEIILTHHQGDLNIDHQITSKATITACRPKHKNRVNLILFFEILSSTEYAINPKNQNFNPNWYEDISKYINLKIKAIKCYQKELRFNPHSRSIKTIKSLSIFRGSSSGVKYAEAFELGRKI